MSRCEKRWIDARWKPRSLSELSRPAESILSQGVCRTARVVVLPCLLIVSVTALFQGLDGLYGVVASATRQRMK